MRLRLVRFEGWERRLDGGMSEIGQGDRLCSGTSELGGLEGGEGG